MNADAMIGWVALIVMVLVFAVFLRARSSSNTSSANTRSNTSSKGDALAEAEVYLAYGQKNKTIEILSAALGRYPDREDIRIKLNAIRHDF